MPVDQIAYIDHPDLKINQNESTQMPFRYVKGDDGQPIMPEVRASRTWHVSGGGQQCADKMDRACVI